MRGCMNEEVRVEADTKGIAWILTGITDNSEYGYKEFVKNGLIKAVQAADKRTDKDSATE